MDINRSSLFAVTLKFNGLVLGVGLESCKDEIGMEIRVQMRLWIRYENGNRIRNLK